MKKIQRLAVVVLALLPIVAAAQAGIGANIGGGSGVKLGPCESGYTRVAPNFCLATVPLQVSSTDVYSAGCVAVSLPSADAKAVVFRIQASLHGENATGSGANSLLVQFWTDEFCSFGSHLESFRAEVTEWSATADEEIYQFTDQLLVPTASSLWVFGGGGSGTSASVLMRAIGYYD